MNWYLKVLRNYAGFTGRARRKEYWMFVLYNIVFAVVAMIFDNVLGTTFKMSSMNDMAIHLPYGYIYFIYALAVLIPGLAVFVRRMHDIGKSGWWILLAFIPLIGAIWLLVLACTEGTHGDNQYGPDPKAIATPEVASN